MHPLDSLGWDAALDRAFAPHASDSPNLEPARILEVRRDSCLITTGRDDLVADLSGRLRHGAAVQSDLPAAGDFVVALPRRIEGRATIRAILPRRSHLARRFAGRKRLETARDTDVQVVVANVDHVLVLSSLNADFSPRRLERFLSQVWEGGAQPVVVLTKADLCDDVAARVAAAEAVAPGVPVHAVSAKLGDGLAAFAGYLRPGRTAALVGSSGVGKSTLVNALFGEDVQVVREIREHDDTGQHTTTSRRLVRLPGRGAVIDTPGMRELGLWESEGGVAETFSDVEDLAASCRFRDCGHATEPGCAVRSAIESGAMPEDRLTSWHHLQRELRFAASKERKRARALTKGGARRDDDGVSAAELAD